MSRDCYYDNNGCLVCPELPAVPATPPRALTNPNLGWNAGANSIQQLAGDVHLTESLDAVPTGIVIGFKTSRSFNTDPSLVLHGLYLFTVAGRAFIQVIEQGQIQGAAQGYTLGTVFEIRRVRNEVSYWLGGVLLRKTTAKTLDPLLVNACLYAAGDTLP